jgi:transcriptional regulator with XRE-family HTH domain
MIEARKGAKLTAAEAKAIRLSPETGVELARRYGISRATVSRIKSGLSWKRFNGTK